MTVSRRAFLLAAPLAALPLSAAESFVRVSRRDPRYLELSDGSRRADGSVKLPDFRRSLVLRSN